VPEAICVFNAWVMGAARPLPLRVVTEIAAASGQPPGNNPTRRTFPSRAEYAPVALGSNDTSARPVITASRPTTASSKYWYSTGFNPTAMFCRSHARRIWSWLVLAPTTTFNPATSAGVLIFRIGPSVRV